MTLRNICWGLILFTSLTASAGEILTSDQVNLLKIERQDLIESRDFNIEQIVLNEKKIEMLIEWANGDKPSTLADKVAPAAGAISTGAAATALLHKYMPQLLARLPLSVQRIVKGAPALAGLIASVYFGYDGIEYNGMVNQLKSYTTPSSQQDLYKKLLSNREYFKEQIELLSLQINALDAQLNMYE